MIVGTQRPHPEHFDLLSNVVSLAFLSDILAAWGVGTTIFEKILGGWLQMKIPGGKKEKGGGGEGGGIRRRGERSNGTFSVSWSNIFGVQRERSV